MDTTPERSRRLVEHHSARASALASDVPKLRALAVVARAFAEETRGATSVYERSGEMIHHAVELVQDARQRGYEGDEVAVAAIVKALREQSEQIALQMLQRASECDEAAARAEGERAALLSTVDELGGDRGAE